MFRPLNTLRCGIRERMDAQLYHRYSSFRCNLLFLLVVALATGRVVAAENEQKPEPKKDPEAVYVAVEQASLYAGPSSDFYPTGNIKRGTALEVYLRTGNGWLGVRPPQGSFSWVPASQAYLLPGGRVIEITDANAVSWIGTELGSAKQYRWQVQLKVGEQLSVLGEATIKSDAADREALWYKVAPPAGEFRWIEQAAISKTAPQVKPTLTPNESQLAANENEPRSNQTKINSNEASIVEGATKGTEKSTAKAAVQSASFESPATNEVRSPNRSPKKSSVGTTAKGKQDSSSRPRSTREDQWDGWYAFEMGESGMRTPFLDKLSGRDRGPQAKHAKAPAAQHDPLIHDPFSLAMAGESAKSLPNEPIPAVPLRSELNSVAKKQREWRDPRSLREARLAGTAVSQTGSLARGAGNTATSGDAATSVLTASSNNLQPAADGLVNTAGFEQSETRQTADLAADTRAVVNNAAVNWYGLSDGAGKQLNTSPNSNMNVVTNTADVAELQLALNNAVSSSHGPWNLAPLAERARYLIEHGPTAIDRGQARLMLERIDAFQSVSARSQQVASPVQSTSYNAGTQNMSLPNTPAPMANYDATGWLVPVHAAGPDQPSHALTNDTGDVIAYVSPIAGLNLDRYRNQAVGINGLRGYLPQLQAAHIQAQRVSRVR
ncbi:MAG: hypothetical protein SFV81_22870 [Pirellulaceae bacterium]|nr:hypothetical protein [Pirellulaceae bacterium]